MLVDARGRSDGLPDLDRDISGRGMPKRPSYPVENVYQIFHLCLDRMLKWTNSILTQHFVVVVIKQLLTTPTLLVIR